MIVKDEKLDPRTVRMILLGVALFVLLIAATTIGLMMFVFKEGDARLSQSLVAAFSFTAVLFLSGLAALILVKMAIGTIDLRYLIADGEGSASLSRFQMLLFTFVVAGLYFLYALYTLFSLRIGTHAAACSGDSATLVQAMLNNAIAVQSAARGATADVAPAFQQAGKAMQDAAAKLASACHGLSLPEIPGSVLGLIGISGGSYLVSKGIQAASDSSKKDDAGAPMRKIN